MAKGENIFKRKDGRWEARYIKYYEPSGKIKYGYCYGKTYKEAKEKVTKCKASIIAGKKEKGRGSDKVLSEYAEEWLQINRNRIKESTYVKYAGVIDKYIVPEFGKYRASELTNIMVENFTTGLLNKNSLAPKTVKDILVILQSVLKYASKQNRADCEKICIIYPKLEKKEMRVLTREEQRKFVKYLADDMNECKFGVLLALCTGMRIGEICALRWKDIIPDDNVIHVRTTMQRLKNIRCDKSSKTVVHIDSPKSYSSVRVIPLSDIMAKLCNKMRPANPECYILTGTKSYMEPRVLQYRLKKYTTECDLNEVHFHTLRHTFATRCTEAGFDIKSLSEILGHASTSITLDRYVHSSIELKRSNMNKLPASLQFEQSNAGVI